MAEGNAPTVSRLAPNVLVTGTPGVGKSTLCRRVSQMTGLRWVEISKVAKDNGCLGEYDQEYGCPVLDEDRLLDGLEEEMSAGGNLVDYHSAEMFPERWFDAVFVLRTDNTTLYDRLAARGYSGRKLDDNVSCEIFQVILDEALASYKPEIVHTLPSSTLENLEDNANSICCWLQQWFLKNE